MTSDYCADTAIDYDPNSGSRCALRRYVNGPNSSYLQWIFSNFDAQGNSQLVTDPNGRVTNIRLDGSLGTALRDYAHDAYGNRIYDGAAPFTGTPSLLYDDANRLVEVRDPANAFATIATYRYDAFGRRVKKVVGAQATLFFYDGEGHLVEEIKKNTGANNDQVRFYVFVDDELMGLADRTAEVGSAAWLVALGAPIEIQPPLVILALTLAAGIGIATVTRRWPVGIATTTSGVALLLLCAGTTRGPTTYRWVHVDPLGTPLAVTNSPETGAAVAIWRARYEPFGKATVDEDPDGNNAPFTLNVRFPGQYADAETGWHSNGFRTYDPLTGRYLEPDPARQSYLLTQAGVQFHIPTLSVSAEGPGRIGPPDASPDPEATRLRTLTLGTQAGDGNLFSYARNAPAVYRDSKGAGPTVGIAVCLSAAIGLGVYNYLGTADFALQLKQLRENLDALEEIIAKLREACADPALIKAFELQKLKLAELLARTQAAVTLHDATLAALGIGGGAACRVAWALPTP